MPRKPLTIPDLRSTPEQRAASLERARKYYQEHIAPIDKLWGECERKVKERMMETKPAPERPLAERVAELETIVQSILRREAEDIVAQHEQPALYPCEKCGKMRTKAEGGTVFTVCDECWNTNKQPAPAPSVADVLDRLREAVRAAANRYTDGENWSDTSKQTWHDKGVSALEEDVLALIDAARREAGR